VKRRANGFWPMPCWLHLNYIWPRGKPGKPGKQATVKRLAGLRGLGLADHCLHGDLRSRPPTSGALPTSNQAELVRKRKLTGSDTIPTRGSKLKKTFCPDDMPIRLKKIGAQTDMANELTGGVRL